MPRVIVTLNAPIFKVALTQAGLTAGTAYQCQLTQAQITASPNLVSIPATGCAGASQSAGLSSFALELAWLQDWTSSAGGLSGWAMANDGKQAWFELTLDTATPTNKAVGNCYVVAGNYGGVFGDGTPAASSSTWPMLAAPTITSPALLIVEGQLVEDGQTVEGQEVPVPQDEPAAV